MAESHQYQTTISITGQISPEMLKSLKETTGHLAKIRVEAKGVGHDSKHGFELFKHSAEGAKEAAGSLKEVMGELLAPIAAVTAGFMTIKGTFGILDEAAEKYKDMENSISQFKSVVASTDAVAKHGESLRGLMKQFSAVAVTAGQHAGNIYGQGLYRGIEEKLVAGAGLRPETIAKGLLEGIPLAVARMGTGITGVTKENTAEFAQAIAQGIQTGRISRDISGFDQAHLKAFRAATIEQRIQMILQSRYFRNGKEYLAEQRRDHPEEIKLMQLRIANDKDRIALGEKYLGIHEQLESLSLRVQDIFLNTLNDAITPLLPAIEQAMNAAEEGIKSIGGWVKWLFASKNFAEFGTRLKDAILNAITSVEGLWNTTFKNDDLKIVVDTFTGAVAGLHHALGDDIGNDLRALVAAIVSWKAINLIGGFTQWLKNIGFLNVKAAVVNVSGPVATAGAASTAANAGGLVSGALALGAAAAPAVIAAAATAATVNMLLKTTNKDPLLNRDADLAEKIAAENEAYIAAQKTLAIKFDSGNTDQEAYIKALKELDIQHQKQLDDLQKLRTSNNALIESNAAVGTAAQQAAQALKLITSQMGNFPIAGGGSGGTAGAGGPVRAEAYGPSQGEHTNATMHGPLGALQNGQYAVSPDLSAGHRLGQQFSFTDAGGAVHTGVYADHSWKNAYQPNRNTIEAWNGKDLGTVSQLHWLANGGIVSKKTLALLGERGKEAVVPLSRGSLDKHGLGSASHYSPTINFAVNVTGGNENAIVDRIRGEFTDMMNESYFEFKRRQLE